MTDFVDTYLKSTNADDLVELSHFVSNMIPVSKGSETAGDPNYFYTCVRSIFPIPSFAGVEVCTPEEAIPVVGMWA